MQNRPLFSLTSALCTPVWTSYLYYSKPRYLTAFLVNLAAAAMAIVMATITRIYLRKQNAKLEKGLAVGRSGPTLAQQAAGFRYLL
jgi:NADH:ubiquinone oxidoreductase subunit K